VLSINDGRKIQTVSICQNMKGFLQEAIADIDLFGSLISSHGLRKDPE